MQRKNINPRPMWQHKVEEQGFLFHSLGGEYWNESACYDFSTVEREEIERATNELHALCLATVQHIIDRNRFAEMCISPGDEQLIRSSWSAGERSVYGRFDLCYDGSSPPKMFEYNADTPTSLLEAGLIQRLWCEEVVGSDAQLNLIHERLIDAWRGMNLKGPVHFSAVEDSEEDRGNVQYLQLTAAAAGLETKYLPIQAVGFSESRGTFCDLEGSGIATWFKLYPWEWLVHDNFATHVRAGKMRLIEPAWKMLLSNKMILPLLWELFPGHPNLLPSYTDPGKIIGPVVRKPVFGREGANVSIHLEDRTVFVPGEYSNGPVVYQSFKPLPEFNGRYPMVGSWVIGGRAAGIGIRESAGLISENRSHFVPHYVV